MNERDSDRAKNAMLHDRIALGVVASGLLLTLVTFALFGGQAAAGALAGALVALGNWMLIRWVARRVARPGSTKRATMVLFGFKTVTLMTLCWILVVRVGLDAKGFMIGISALVLGIVLGPMLPGDGTSGEGLPAQTEEG